MSGRVILTYHPLYDGRGFSPVVRSWGRYRAAWELFETLGLFRTVQHVRQAAARPEDLIGVHPEPYVDFVRRRDRDGSGYLDDRETPAWRGVFERALVAVGGTLEAVEMVLDGAAAHAFNPSGGLHHAHREHTSGFCIFNDIALAVNALQRRGVERIAIVDVDGHHGDGTQEILYDRPVLKLSLHQYDGRFFPGTGSLDEVGWGEGFGYSVNVGLPRRCGDLLYGEAWRAIVPTVLRAYSPEVILLNFGVDGHYADPLVKLGLTTAVYREIATAMHRLAHDLCGGRLIAFGSGGYHPEHVARCWATLLAVLAGELPELDLVRPDGECRDGEWPEPFRLLEDTGPVLAEADATIQAARDSIARLQSTVLPLRLVA